MKKQAKNDKELLQCAIDVGELDVRNAFKKYTFVYGTAGKGSAVIKAAKTMFSKQSRFKKEQQILDRELNLFDTGVRATTYLKGQNTQMMDMYYGQAGNMLYQLRDPAIGAFVHKALSFKGPYSHKISGRDAYYETYGAGPEAWNAWDDNVPRMSNNNTITVEMSRIIRWGVGHFGGKLTFEGREVYYSQVFDHNAYHGDTDYEAMSLLKAFNPESGHTVTWGTKGKLTFMWNGVATKPTHCHFLSNWGHDNIKQVAVIEANRAGEMGKFDRFHEHSSKSNDKIGAQHHSALNRGNFDQYLKKAGVHINMDLWNKFADRPVGALSSISSDTIIRLLAHG